MINKSISDSRSSSLKALHDSISTYVNELKHFLQCSKKNQTSINSLNQGIKVLNIALTVLKSSTTRKMEKI